MTTQEAKNLTNDVFKLVTDALSISELEKIFDRKGILKRNKMSDREYPKIDFKISKSEIRLLREKNILDDELCFVENISSELTDPLTKLLYATVWKNGDLKKIKHIIKGIEDSGTDTADQEDALVFYQFGKYLTKIPGQPIIDQHVIRAYAIHRLEDEEEIEKWRRTGTLHKKHKDIIKDYKSWLISDNLAKELRSELDYTYYIDKILFATGKSIKLHRGSK